MAALTGAAPQITRNVGRNRAYRAPNVIHHTSSSKLQFYTRSNDALQGRNRTPHTKSETFQHTSPPMDRLVFSFALFPGRDVDAFGYYRDSCLKFIKEMSEAFDGCMFVAHLLDAVDPLTCKALMAAARGRVTIKRYTFPKKRGVCWLVSALRLRTLWEHSGDHTVIVADVHDDVGLQVKQVCFRTLFVLQCGCFLRVL
jgi:hypothetical protein